LYRRDYAAVKGLPRETFTMAHMSGKITIPILAYDDSYLDGENFRGVVKDSYLDVVSLDAFRAEFMGRQWGLMPFFLPEFDAQHAAQVEPTRGMMALLMLHDVSLWPIWCNVKVVNEALAALDEFGYVAAEFIPYFASVPPASTNMADVYVSAYKRPKGQVLLIVGNLSKEDRQGEVRIEAGTLGIRLGKIVTWPQKEPVVSHHGSVQLDVPRIGYRIGHVLGVEAVELCSQFAIHVDFGILVVVGYDCQIAELAQRDLGLTPQPDSGTRPLSARTSSDRGLLPAKRCGATFPREVIEVGGRPTPGWLVGRVTPDHFLTLCRGDQHLRLRQRWRRRVAVTGDVANRRHLMLTVRRSIAVQNVVKPQCRLRRARF
jgi:hypothetical protein